MAPVAAAHSWSIGTIPGIPGAMISNNGGVDGLIVGDLTQSDCMVLLGTFVVFSVAFAIIRNLFGRMWGKIPEKNNWKQSFKRRLGNNKP